MLKLLTSSSSVLHYKKLGIDAAFIAAANVVPDTVSVSVDSVASAVSESPGHATLILNLLVVVGRIVTELIIKRRERRKQKQS